MSDYKVAYVSCDWDPVAVFLDSGSDCNPGDLLTYSAAGEHAEAAIDWIREQPPATEDEYRDLHAHLFRRYADPGQGGPLTRTIDQAGLPY